MADVIYSHGAWSWDDNEYGVIFTSFDAPKPKAIHHTTAITQKQFSGSTGAGFDIKFKELIDVLDQIRFRRHFQRRVKPNEPDIIILRDVKDVVLFQLISPLPVEFIELFHTPGVDRFLRSLIVYIQFFLQVSDTLTKRREEKNHKLWHPNVDASEQLIRDNVSQLRCVVGRDYGSLLLGLGHLNKFHHLSNKQRTSASEKDSRLYELLYRISVRIVWVTLQRRSLNAIEMEISRLFRTESFNMHKRHKVQDPTNILQTPEGAKILHDDLREDIRKLLNRSPAIKELLKTTNDYRVLAKGIVSFKSDDERVKFLEWAYTAPEEDLYELNIPIGILGQPRNNFDVILIPKEVPKSEPSYLRLTSQQIPPLTATTGTTSAQSDGTEGKGYADFIIPAPCKYESIPNFFPKEKHVPQQLHPEYQKEALLIWKEKFCFASKTGLV